MLIVRAVVCVLLAGFGMQLPGNSNACVRYLATGVRVWGVGFRVKGAGLRPKSVYVMGIGGWCVYVCVYVSARVCL